MNYKNLDDFLKNVINNDEVFNKAKNICSENCIMDLDTLLELS